MKRILTLIIMMTLVVCGCGSSKNDFGKDTKVLNIVSNGNGSGAEVECVNYIKNYFCMIVNYMYLNDESDDYECLLYYDSDTDSIKYEEVLYDDYVDTLVKTVVDMYGSDSEEKNNLEDIAEFEAVGRDVKIEACEQLVNSITVDEVDGNSVILYSVDEKINLEYNPVSGNVTWL